MINKISVVVCTFSPELLKGLRTGDKTGRKVPTCIIVLELMWGGVEGKCSTENQKTLDSAFKN